MTESPPTRQGLLERPGTLLITRSAAAPDPHAPPPPAGAAEPPTSSATAGSNRDGEPDIYVAVLDDGSVLGFNGHVDLGTGIRTALAQIVAEELDVALDRVTMVLGDTERAPNQGATIASETIQITAEPLRRAAAQARWLLLGEAAARLGAPVEALAVEDGTVRVAEDPARRIDYAALLHGRALRAELDGAAPLKPVAAYRVVGQPVPRVDIPAKATGAFSYVHDLRVPGMLHGRVVRPPYLGHDGGDFVGRSLLSVDESSVAHIDGLVAVVTIGDFVGVVATREENADRAMRALRVEWKPFAPTVDLRDIDRALRLNPSTRRVLADTGDVDQALAGAAKSLRRSYAWPYQMHASIGPSCAVADHAPGRLVVWSGTQNPHVLRGDLARLLGMGEHEVEVVRLEAAGCYGRNCADDVSGDAALLSRAVGRPVRVQLTREQEHAWEPKGAAQLCDVAGGLDAEGGLAAYDFTVRYPSNLAPMLPLLLTGVVPPVPATVQMGDRTAIPPYDYKAMRVVCEDMPPLVRAAWLRGVSALPNSFAHECFIDELAVEAGADPVEFRLRHLPDRRAADLVRAVAERAKWEPRTGARLRGEGDILRGQGFAYALYVHSKFPGFGAAWAAWVAEVEVNRRTGEVTVGRITVGQDTGQMINPAGVRHQVHGNVVQATSRALKERVTFDERSLVSSREWGGYPIMTFREVPEIDVLLMPRQSEPPLGGGESASVPGAAAIANAIYDATGVRFRSPPFTADVILAGLDDAAPTPPAPPRRRRWLGALAGIGTALATAGAGLLGLHAAIPPAAPPGPDVYSATLIERGRLLAAAGDCAVCHTAPGGVAYAGGHALETPFGTVFGTNLTPDVETGIGAWSFAAFQRAMREGISRDGRNLYPAFPYTSFTRMTDADLLALYAYLMSRPAVRNVPPETKLAFPYGIRPLLAGWNLLFHRPGAQEPDPSRSAEWNRGNYLVNALGHCGACHTPRNALGAERRGAYLAGGEAEGWDAPAFGTLAAAPVPWTERSLFDYLRTGHSPEHGVAAGPMAPVVAELTQLPDADIRAMAHYLASLGGAPDPAAAALRAREVEAAAWRDLGGDASPGARLFQGACGACHHDGNGPAVLGAHVSMPLNTSIHAARPDNLIRVILDGIQNPARDALGHMPGFRDSLSDAQVAELAAFLRRRFAPDRPAWEGVEAVAARLR
ncbi:molybdopterin-dependent oxidoreductase [Roseomonas sp. NAR14]|uniref:Molybdopterin-dependent oxidoreductase n=1 Tax=Roseomonas acroporae TaxID=2937791 RepID=A0A9X2BUI1_9PROT|nr:molybdopterin cofactor-binding domain-containing protein [Roseomonas acroporae]MCK8783089.1 molybdopterin-dependent oxidoreductase [Roseomonas acroporae]